MRYLVIVAVTMILGKLLVICLKKSFNLLKYVRAKLDLILEKLNAIEKRLDKIENSCGAMDTHIGFVDGVYTTLEDLDFIVNKVSLLAERIVD